MSKTMETIESYLKEMNLTYKVIAAEDRIILPYTIDDRRFLLIVDRSDKWVRFFIIIVEADNLKNVDKAKLYESLLEANGQLAEIKYFITEQGAVGVIGHEGVASLSLEGFQEEYNALPYAVSYFINNIASKLNIEVKGVE
ncbi:MAG: YbjN domain-containing protein [Candidatus Hermodarchaeia archaeon]